LTLMRKRGAIGKGKISINLQSSCKPGERSTRGKGKKWGGGKFLILMTKEEKR